MEFATLPLAFLAGLVSIFSPCVLPLVPVVFGTALSENRFGPAALAAGLILSFLAIGMFVASIGFSIGLDSERMRLVAAILLVTAGAVLLVPAFQARVATAGAPLSNWIDQRFSSPSPGLLGQFGVGLLLGAVWTPCVGPTVGAVTVLAAQRQNLGQVTFTMFVFAVGTALPLIAIGLLSREVLARWRGRLLSTGRAGKITLGSVMVIAGLFIISGFDKVAETALLNVTPDWLTDLTTSF
jgi:cytochrome c-type biogenesis protein